MSGKQFVTELVEGRRVDSVFVLRSREMRASRSGEAYLTLDLADRTGCIGAVLFRPDSLASGLPSGTVVRAAGTVTTWRGARRVSLDSLSPAQRWDRHDMIAAAVRPSSELVCDLRALVGGVRTPQLRAILKDVFGDGDFFARFVESPASQSYHHAYLGGLLEHTVSVSNLAMSLASAYAGVDPDLLVAAALLHDIGKVDELEFETSIDYSDRGRLLGHVVLGAQRLHAAAERCGAEPALVMRLEHAVLSHHGELEWGAPKRPSTLEALLLHHIDNLDAKASGFSDALNGAALVEESWTDAYNLFRRPLFAPKAAEDDRAAIPAEDAQHHRRSA